MRELSMLNPTRAPADCVGGVYVCEIATGAYHVSWRMAIMK